MLVGITLHKEQQVLPCLSASITWQLSHMYFSPLKVWL